jgi:hypothetical protein
MRHILLAATALAMLSGAAYADNSTSNSHSTATASNRSASTSRSAAIGNVGNSSNININTYAGVDSSGSGSGSSSATTAATDPSYGISYSGGYTVRNVPEVIPPNVVGGNPCSVGASGGMSVAGFGIAGGATWADKQCERRQQAALLFNIGKQRAATELLCQDANVRAALRVAGEPCAADAAPVAVAAPAPVAQAAPAVIEPPAPATPTRPEWCWTTGPAELRHHAECNVKS